MKEGLGELIINIIIWFFYSYFNSSFSFNYFNYYLIYFFFLFLSFYSFNNYLYINSIITVYFYNIILFKWSSSSSSLSSLSSSSSFISLSLFCYLFLILINNNKSNKISSSLKSIYNISIIILFFEILFLLSYYFNNQNLINWSYSLFVSCFPFVILFSNIQISLSNYELVCLFWFISSSFDLIYNQIFYKTIEVCNSPFQLTTLIASSGLLSILYLGECYLFKFELFFTFIQI